MKKIIKIILSVISFILILGCAFMYVNAQENQFDDVKETDWFYYSVMKVWDLGIMDGKSPSVFAPKSVMTRAEFVTLISRIAKADLDGMNEFASEKFTDIPTETWFAPYVGWGVSAGIVTGYTDGTFLPNNPVSRQELAVMIVRFMNLQGIEISEDNSLVESFTDKKSIGSWARSQVELLRLSGLISGDENGNFNPKKPASRAEVASIAGRYHDVSEEYFSLSIPENLFLEYSVGSIDVVSVEDLIMLLESAVTDRDQYDTVNFKDIQALVELLNSLEEAVHEIEVQVIFTRGNVSETGSYILHFKRESTPSDEPIETAPESTPSEDPIDTTPESTHSEEPVETIPESTPSEEPVDTTPETIDLQ